MKITDQFEVKNYIMGKCKQPIKNKTYFVGNCFGTISPGLGFGQFASILTGVYAAYDICGFDDYKKLVRPLFENYEHSLVLRRSLEKLDDKAFDKIVGNINTRFVDNIISHVFSSRSRFDLLKLLTPFLR